MICSIPLTYVRSTKGLCRYEENVRAGEAPMLGVLYVSKARFGTKAPKRLVLSLEEVVDATD